MKTLIAFTAVAVAASAWSAQVTDVKVNAVDGFGGDTGSVVSRCQTKVGQEYDPVSLSRDVKTLKDSNEFEDISADAKEVAGGVEVTFVVRRKMRYHAPAAVEGADFFSESKVLKEADLKDGYLYGEADLAVAAANVRLAYQKKHFPDAKVTPVVEPLGNGNDCTVKFVVEEGTRKKIATYEFDGNESVEADELREAIGDLPWWNPLGWFSDSPTTDEQLKQCVAKIEEVYRNRGFLDVKVSHPILEPREGGKAAVVFPITEGTCYKVGETKITGLTRYPEGVVREKSELPAAGAVAGWKALGGRRGRGVEGAHGRRAPHRGRRRFGRFRPCRHARRRQDDPLRVRPDGV